MIVHLTESEECHLNIGEDSISIDVRCPGQDDVDMSHMLLTSSDGSSVELGSVDELVNVCTNLFPVVSPKKRTSPVTVVDMLNHLKDMVEKPPSRLAGKMKRPKPGTIVYSHLDKPNPGADVIVYGMVVSSLDDQIHVVTTDGISASFTREQLAYNQVTSEWFLRGRL